ncbi:MAG TPA: hypothetical protein VL693_17685 [Vicinamibacterales bacterium]|jgi:hypothetical protein|nr:hypothetical protein [Vicinamibacterales bacterium]
MGDPTPPDHPRMMELLRQLNELIAEAQRLRQHVETAAREKPIWPERRRIPRTPAKRGRESND